MNNPKHPATYTNTFIPIFAELLAHKTEVLDPFAGTGKLALIKEHGFTGKVICNEIESEWTLNSPYAVDKWHVGDARNLSWLESNSLSAICTSPTYGNRMADHHVPKDNSKRITYTHYLGRQLTDGNTGKMQWGEEYQRTHFQVYQECHRVLKSDGLMIVNISNHIRRGEEIPVVDWHLKTLQELNFSLNEHIKIKTPRMRFGRNGNKRVEEESILVFIK